MNRHVFNSGAVITFKVVRASLAAYSAVHSPKVLADGFADDSRGGAFVEILDKNEAQQAINNE